MMSRAGLRRVFPRRMLTVCPRVQNEKLKQPVQQESPVIQIMENEIFSEQPFAPVISKVLIRAFLDFNQFRVSVFWFSMALKSTRRICFSTAPFKSSGRSLLIDMLQMVGWVSCMSWTRKALLYLFLIAFLVTSTLSVKNSSMNIKHTAWTSKKRLIRTQQILRKVLTHSISVSYFLALRMILERVPEDPVFVIGTGTKGRLDHQMSQIHTLVKISNEFKSPVYFLRDTSLMRVLKKGAHRLALNTGYEGKIGLVPVDGECNVRTTGLKWNIDGPMR